MIRRTILLLFGLFWIQLGISQDSTSAFSLNEAVEYALANSRIAKNANRDILIAENQKWQTTAKGLPQINASVAYNKWVEQQVSLLPGEFTGGTPGTFAPVAFGTEQTMDAKATLSQLIFDGSFVVGLQSAKVFLQISKDAKLKTDLEIKKEIIEAYGNVLLAEESTKILEKNISVLNKNLEETREIFKNGLAEEESVEQLEITLSGLKSNLNYTIRLRDLSYQMLNIVMGKDVYAKTVLTDDLETLTKKSFDQELLNQETNISNNMDYRIAQSNLSSKEMLLKLEKSKYLPSINAFVNGGYNTGGNSFTFANSDHNWYGYSMLGLNMSIPIFSSFDKKAATQIAAINFEKAKDDLTETEQKLKFQMESAKSDYQLSIEEYLNKKKSLALSESIEKKNQTKFKEGVSSSFDLRQAQMQLYSAQQEYLQAMQMVINKKTNLETLINKG
jgi:outer membrane protein TolC